MLQKHLNAFYTVQWYEETCFLWVPANPENSSLLLRKAYQKKKRIRIFPNYTQNTQKVKFFLLWMQVVRIIDVCLKSFSRYQNSIEIYSSLTYTSYNSISKMILLKMLPYHQFYHYLCILRQKSWIFSSANIATQHERHYLHKKK